MQVLTTAPAADTILAESMRSSRRSVPSVREGIPSHLFPSHLVPTSVRDEIPGSSKHGKHGEHRFRRSRSPAARVAAPARAPTFSPARAALFMPGSAMEEALPPHSPFTPHRPFTPHSQLMREGSSSRSPFVPTADKANAKPSNAKPSNPLPVCKCSPRRQSAYDALSPSHEEPPLPAALAARSPSEVIPSHLCPSHLVPTSAVGRADAEGHEAPFTPHSSLHTEGHEAPWLQSAKEQWLNGNMEAARKILSESFLANPFTPLPSHLSESFLANPHIVQVGSTPPTGAVQVGSTPPTGAVQVGSTPPTGAVQVGSTPPTGAVQVGNTCAPNGPPRSAVHASAHHGARRLRDGPPRSAVHCSFNSDVPPSGTHGRTQGQRTDHRIEMPTSKAPHGRLSQQSDGRLSQQSEGRLSQQSEGRLSQQSEGRLSQQSKQPPEDSPGSWRHLFDAWRKESY